MHEKSYAHAVFVFYFLIVFAKVLVKLRHVRAARAAARPLSACVSALAGLAVLAARA